MPTPRTATYGNNNGASTTLVMTEPSGAAENDILFAWHQMNGTLTDAPDGWTLLNTWSGDDFQICRLYWRRRTSSALTAAERTFTSSNAAYWQEAEMLAFSGCPTAGNPWDDAQYTTQGDRSAPNPPSATSSGTGRMAVAFAGKWDTAGTGGATAPTNYTLTRTGNTNDGNYSAYRAVDSGAEDPGTFGNSGSATEACSEATIILAPAASGSAGSAVARIGGQAVALGAHAGAGFALLSAGPRAIAAGVGPAVELFMQLDETSANDTDYITTTTVGAYYECGLSTVTDPGVDTAHIVRVRAKAAGAVFKVGVYQNTTLIEEWTETLTASWATYPHTLAQANVANITDYSALRLRLTVL